MSIVLVIIGLIVGGVLVGQSLINAAAVRAQITQIEKFNTATNTFYGKFGYLPGDIPKTPASQFGFVSRGSYLGEGDGNGFLEGVFTIYSNNQNNGGAEGVGETAAFWNDLGTAHLIEGSYIGLPNGYPTAGNDMSSAVTNSSSFFPQAKLGANSYVYVWGAPDPNGNPSGLNYFGVSTVTSLGPYGGFTSSPNMTVQQAYTIDTKVDDGLPESGRVIAFYDGGASGGAWPAWASNATNNYGQPFTTATAGSSLTCFDNGGVAGAMKYSLAQKNGAGVNCALSFKMQAGD